VTKEVKGDRKSSNKRRHFLVVNKINLTTLAFKKQWEIFARINGIKRKRAVDGTHRGFCSG